MASAPAARPRAPLFIDPPGYARHRPEETLRYRLVEQHYPELVAAREAAGRALPRYVREECRSRFLSAETRARHVLEDGEASFATTFADDPLTQDAVYYAPARQRDTLYDPGPDVQFDVWAWSSPVWLSVVP